MAGEALPLGLREGWAATLDLGYALRDGATVPVLRRHAGPLRVLRYSRDEAGACEQVLVHPPGGIAGGDRLCLEFDLAAGSDVLVTSVGAGKWYRGFGRAATQRVTARLGPRARLAWLPLENILFSGAEATLSARFCLAPEATLFYADVVCLGRPAAGERFTEGHWRQCTEIERDGRLLWCERTLLPGGSALMTAPAGLAGHPVLGTVVYAGPPLPAALHAAVRALNVDGVACASQLPEVWVGRFLGDRAEEAQRWIRNVRSLVHEHTHGRQAREPRIWAT